MSSSEAGENQEPEHEPDTCMEVEGFALASRTKLTTTAPAFQPLPKRSTRLYSVTDAAYLVLESCGQATVSKMENGVQGQSSALIMADLLSGPRAQSRCYDAVQLVKQALDAIVARLPNTSLISSSIQKEVAGYSLRTSIAFLPDGVADVVCWDILRQGSCKRRSQCRWYHPQQADIGKIRVNIGYAKEATEVSSDEQSEEGSTFARHKISLRVLV